MKVAKVDVAREWMDPGIFKLTTDLSRLSTPQVAFGPLPLLADASGGVDWKQVNDRRVNEALFPSYPVAFVVAKDIRLRFRSTLSSFGAVKSVVDSRSASGGGFLCFSVSSSSGSHSESQSMHSNTEDTVFTIFLPGAQVLGWFMEMTPADHSTPLSDEAAKTGDHNLDIIKFVHLLQGGDATKRPALRALTNGAGTVATQVLPAPN